MASSNRDRAEFRVRVSPAPHPWPLVRFLILAAILSAVAPARADDFHTQMVKATFKLDNSKTAGTSFLLTRPAADKPGAVEWILIAAAHEFEEAPGDNALLMLRKRMADGSYVKIPQPLLLRKDGKLLWRKHPLADVAAMRILPPAKDLEPPHLSVDLLADDEAYTKYGIHPGDQVHSCGYPHLNESGDSGFPLVRMGSISGYPLTPAKTVKSYFVDLNVFEGDSGSPLYLTENNRTIDGQTQSGPVHVILGVVVGQRFFNEDLKWVYGSMKLHQRMGFAVVAPAQFVRELLADLPPPSAVPEPRPAIPKTPAPAPPVPEK